MTQDRELELIEKIGWLKGQLDRSEAEVRLLWRMLNEARDKAQANWDLMETVAIGEKLECHVCKQYHPCQCDKS